jgi:hypothetical protein
VYGARHGSKRDYQRREDGRSVLGQRQASFGLVRSHDVEQCNRKEPHLAGDYVMPMLDEVERQRIIRQRVAVGYCDEQ